ncbi:penicillin acylase family protein [Candidatus Binatia bacterium]|nr:penicillin acylase family protein [Candidatus Binatia bacterium]
MRGRRMAPVGVLVCILGFMACGDNDGAPVPPAPGAADPIAELPTAATVDLSGLQGQVDVVDDALGVPHVYAGSLDDAIFMQGYLTAAARFWQMDAFRRVAEGRLSEILGRVTLEMDVEMRTVFTTRDGRRLQDVLWEHIESTDAETANVVRSYAAGVNAWLADLRAGKNGATLPPEYAEILLIGLKPDQLEPWRPQDTMAIARLQAWSLSETLGEEINFARIWKKVPKAVRRDVFRSAPGSPATVLPVSGRGAAERVAVPQVIPALPSPETLDALAAALAETRAKNPFGDRARGLGSNNWIVSPRLSATGHAMLANDPHLALFNPPVWHMIHLNSPHPDGHQSYANGVMFPGLPGVILGHSDRGAWGGTVAVFDVTDVYVETITTPPDYPASPRTVLFEGRQVPVLRIEETFHIKKRSPATFVIEVVPHHGPMAPDPNLRDDVVGLAATGMSFRWTGHEITNDPRFLLEINRARNVAEFRDALRNFSVGAQNWVWADVNGDIAYFPRVLIPQRPAEVVPYLPVSGTGDAEWLTDSEGRTLWLPAEKIPQATNPAEGFLATANNDQIGNTLDNDPLNDAIYLTYSADIGFRQERIQELLSNRNGVRPPGAKITMADMSAYQYDTASLEAARLMPFLLTAARNRPDLVTPAMADALTRLEAWGEAKAGSAPYDMASGIDPAALRTDVPPRTVPVSAEERSDAIAASIFTGWATRLGRRVLADDFAGTGIGAPGGEEATKAILHILEDIDREDAGFLVHTKGDNGESSLWDDRQTPAVETRDEMLLGALRDGLEFLADEFATTEPENWLWGAIHQVRFQHFFGQAGIGSWDLGPFAAPGGRFTVNPASYSWNSDDYTFSGGPSMRLVVDLDPAGIKAVNALPGGNNGNAGGLGAPFFNRIQPERHYGDRVPGWLNGEKFQYHVSRADVAANAVRKTRYTR